MASLSKIHGRTRPVARRARPPPAARLLLLNGSAPNAVAASDSRGGTEVAKAPGGAARLGGESTSLADIKLLAVLVRFDSAYSGLFKCFRCGVESYPALAAYARFLAA